jgi:UDP-glucose 4-epimerase
MMRSGQTWITGATGGLGRALLQQMPAQRVAAIARGAVPAGLASTVVRTDVATARWSDLLGAGDLIFHLAASVHLRPTTSLEVQRIHEVNAGATARLAAACRQVGAKLVFASTVAVYGPGAAGASDFAPVRALSDYGRSKLAAEDAIRGEGEGGLRYVILRFPLMYGPWGRGNMERMLRAIARRTYWPVGDPATRKSCLFFSDAASALVLAASEPKVERGTHVVGPESPCSLGELHAAAYRSLGRAVPAFSIPYSLALLLGGGADLAFRALGKGPRLAQQVRTLAAPAWVDGSRFAALTGFRAAVSLEEGLRRTAAWLRQREGEG